MASLQFVIDTLCSKLTVEAVNESVFQGLGRGVCDVSEIAARIKSQDRSLDTDSARLIAQAAIQDLSEDGRVRKENGAVFPVTPKP